MVGVELPDTVLFKVGVSVVGGPSCSRQAASDLLDFPTFPLGGYCFAYFYNDFDDYASQARTLS